MRVVTNEQMKKAELLAAKELPGGLFDLMELAGSACAKIITKKLLQTKGNKEKICVVCGGGNNGGDGFVVARKLSALGFAVSIILVLGEPSTENSAAMLKMVKKSEIKIVNAENFDLTCKFLNQADIIVDAVFGTGFSGRVNEKVSNLFFEINSALSKTVSIDIPSGIECDSASAQGAFVKADLTIAIASLKPAHVFKPCSQFCGELAVADIGITENHFSKVGKAYLYTCDDENVGACIKPRNSLAHKGDFGHALVIAGSKRMQGAAVLAAQGAVRCGAGLVTAAFPDAAYNAISPKLTEPLLLPANSNSAGTFSVSALPVLLEAAEKADAVLLGCGLGINQDTKEIVKELVLKCQRALIIDADGINIISENIDILKAAKCEIVLTPHPGEMSRLTGKTIENINQDRISVAKKFALKYGVTLVLKGANTIIASPDGEAFLNTTGNAGMAKGGSGDLLAGMITAFASQGVSLKDAAKCAVYLHGIAGDEAAKRFSQTAITPTDMICELKGLFSKFE